MSILASPIPEDDSTDLTDDEIQGAIDSHSAVGIAKSVQELRAQKTVAGHELRRRKPHLYWRIRFENEKPLVFQVDWLHKLSGGLNG
jgi:hypothetical protein